MKPKSKTLGNIRIKAAYDGSIRKRPKGEDNKTIGFNLDRDNVFALTARLARFLTDKEYSHMNNVLLTAYKNEVNDGGIKLTVLAKEKS